LRRREIGAEEEVSIDLGNQHSAIRVRVEHAHQHDPRRPAAVGYDGQGRVALAHGRRGVGRWCRVRGHRPEHQLRGGGVVYHGQP